MLMFPQLCWECKSSAELKGSYNQYLLSLTSHHLVDRVIKVCSHQRSLMASSILDLFGVLCDAIGEQCTENDLEEFISFLFFVQTIVL